MIATLFVRLNQFSLYQFFDMMTYGRLRQIQKRYNRGTFQFPVIGLHGLQNAQPVDIAQGF